MELESTHSHNGFHPQAVCLLPKFSLWPPEPAQYNCQEAGSAFSKDWWESLGYTKFRFFCPAKETTTSPKNSQEGISLPVTHYTRGWYIKHLKKKKVFYRPPFRIDNIEERNDGCCQDPRHDHKTLEAEARGMGVQGQPGLHSKFQSILGYRCLKTNSNDDEIKVRRTAGTGEGVEEMKCVDNGCQLVWPRWTPAWRLLRS